MLLGALIAFVLPSYPTSEINGFGDQDTVSFLDIHVQFVIGIVSFTSQSFKQAHTAQPCKLQNLNNAAQLMIPVKSMADISAYGMRFCRHEDDDRLSPVSTRLYDPSTSVSIEPQLTFHTVQYV